MCLKRKRSESNNGVVTEMTEIVDLTEGIDLVDLLATLIVSTGIESVDQRNVGLVRKGGDLKIQKK